MSKSSKKKERKPAPSAPRTKTVSPPPAPSKFASLRRYLAWGAIVVALSALGWAGNLFANQGNLNVVAPTLPPASLPTAAPTQAAPTVAPVATTPKPSVRVERVKGNANAKVTIIEYSDYQCPYCAAFVAETLPKIDERYIKTGKVKYIFRALPLVQIHPQAQKAMESAECAGDQGKFWEMHDLLFARQTEWALKVTALDLFKGYAKSLGLNETTFQQCLDSGKYADLTAENMAAAQRLGITGTPSFVIGNRLLPAAFPFEAFVQYIEEDLAK